MAAMATGATVTGADIDDALGTGVQPTDPAGATRATRTEEPGATTDSPAPAIANAKTVHRGRASTALPASTAVAAQPPTAAAGAARGADSTVPATSAVADQPGSATGAPATPAVVSE
ncbi:hypothetical protein DSM43518_03993 [Mycobacterium marinum]|uniref:Uncharacterized protein n=1 Tax=Mycobacterium marinum TaxID=1781 RepID=A0A3E2MRN2_MYCMR|nr:hypothetical protein MM1218R_05350 [Mycobacterium marinum]RFZ05650.1 hypothetical protein DSM43518_03993 [Mycobacterium marinum]RFZ12012.1 hypothetical protein DE4381_00965 [Mycobacterium marinum]RFZ35719.1 hypothetical protein KST_03530 [Mycobacterium marinum]RFZ36207.1 hypothetical protein DAVIS_04130 [Mycobacterium marinum]